MFNHAAPDQDPTIFPYVVVVIVIGVILVGVGDAIRNAYIEWRNKKRNR